MEETRSQPSPRSLDRDTVVGALGRFRTDEPVHLVFMGTKPDIIKQFPVYRELSARGAQVAVCHSGQHTDHEYSGGMLAEFGLPVDISLLMGGGGGTSLGARVAALVEAADTLFATAGELGHTVVPYIHGDTATSMGVAVAAHMNRVACVHVEAGIRTLSLSGEFLGEHLKGHEDGAFDWAAYLQGNRDEANFKHGSKEPFPEQFNTRVSDAASGLHAAPVELDRGFLLGEGFSDDSIVVVGNTVVDAIRESRRAAEESDILTRFPQLASGEFIRVCIHRRENTGDRARFTCYFDAVEELVRGGRSVLWVSLKGTEWALETYELRGRLDALAREFPQTFISTTVWPEYRDVIAAFLHCALLVTDSGSIQEEANTLGIPCVTLRFGSDRAESLFAGGNVLAPPLSAGFVAEVIASAFENRKQLVAEAIYGEGSAAALVDAVLARVLLETGLFRSEEQVLGLPGFGIPWSVGTNP
jgi:UDP-N-acetylglucosamine 2-epimerase (non-hydrolysing)